MGSCNWKCFLAGLIIGILLGLLYCKAIGPPGGQNPQPAPAGMVWTDNDPQNCAKDATEAGIPSVLVELRDGGGNLVSTATTDVNGNYAFPNASVPAGTYDVVIPAPPGSPGCDSDSPTPPGDSTVSVVVPSSGSGPVAEFGYQ